MAFLNSLHIAHQGGEFVCQILLLYYDLNDELDMVDTKASKMQNNFHDGYYPLWR